MNMGKIQRLKILNLTAIPIRFENSGSYRREKTEKLNQDQYKLKLF